MARLLALAIAALMLLTGGDLRAHDPSAYGGLFRSRDLGATWLNADVGLFLSAALTVAVDPGAPNRLLLGTELGVLRSESGGRSWAPEAAGLIGGAVFALAFLPEGGAAIGAAPTGVYLLRDDQWAVADVPDEALPVRAIAFGATSERLLLLGRSGVFASEDGGRSFGRVGELPEAAAISALAVASAADDAVLALVDGRLMLSQDGGRRWQARAAGPDGARLDSLALDPAAPTRLWAGGADRIYVSDDLGASWRTVGQPLPEPVTEVRGIAADPGATTLVATTERGLYRSVDGGATWLLREDNLPIHIEAGPLVRDPSDPQTLYAVYSLMPYAEVWRSAIEGSNLLARADPVSLAGGLAFVLLLMIAGGLLVRWLARLRAARSA